MLEYGIPNESTGSGGVGVYLGGVGCLPGLLGGETGVVLGTQDLTGDLG